MLSTHLDVIFVMFSDSLSPDFSSFDFVAPVDVIIVDDSHVALTWQRPVRLDEKTVELPVVYAAFWKDQDNQSWLHFATVSFVKCNTVNIHVKTVV